MSKGIIDVLPPYEEEFLTSWIVRMLRFYSCGSLNTHSSDIMRTLFGPNSSERPGLYLQKGLQYFIENCDVLHRRVFFSERNMLMYMSVLPFYLAFCDKTEQKKFIEKYTKMDQYIQMENNIGIRNHHIYLEKSPYYKFCPQCLKEQQECYLYREHQIQGNFVCWKHHSILHRVPYSLKWRDIDFISNIVKETNISKFAVPKESFHTAVQVADMVHQVFFSGFYDSLHEMKSKITCKLYELEIITEQGTFFDLKSFAKSLDATYIYDEAILEKEVMCAISNAYTTHINPIIYLLIIRKIFGGFESYYLYVPQKTEGFLLSKSLVAIKRVEEKKHDIDYYIKTLSCDYAILGDTKEEIVVKHIPCGSIYRFSKKYEELRRCRYCKIKYKNSGTKIVSYTRYLDTIEYSKMHGRKSHQIRNYCNEGRIEGVIRTGNDFLIPKDAPYPKDKRKK